MESGPLYTLVIVDEFSQLRGQDLHHLDELHNAIDKAAAIGLLGDRCQTAGFGDERVWHTPTWRRGVHSTVLHAIYRCKDPEFAKVLGVLRTAKPTATGPAGTLTVPQLMRGRRAWRGHCPKVQDVHQLLSKHPETTMMAITRQGAQTLNELAVEAFFSGMDPVCILQGDMESNPANYDAEGKLKPASACVPLHVPCYVGMKLYVTKNVDKDRDYINGMRCTVENYDRSCRALICVTESMHRLAIRPWTDTRFGNKAYCPVRPGYASTVLKMAGSELPHAVLWLDVPHVPGAAYTGMSRVSFGKDLLLGGNLTPDHFTPARV